MSVTLAARGARDMRDSEPSLVQNFDVLVSSPEGVARLRELILMLAVRGKLALQDSSDEPARELMSRVREARRESGRRRSGNEKGDSTDGGSEGLPCELPTGWEWIRLSELGDFLSGKTPSKQRAEYWGGTIPWITPKDMKHLRLADSEDHVSQRAVDDGLTLVPPSSLLVVVRSGILRRTVPTAINEVESTINQDLRALVLVLPELAPYVQLMVRGFEGYILENLTKVGTTVESIQFDAFSEQRFPFPPLSEQSRIVARVDELMHLCDALEAKGRLEVEQHASLLDALLGALTESNTNEDFAATWQRVVSHFDLLIDRPEAVDALEQTMLNLAVYGRLVRHHPDDEPASELLIRIASEKQRLVAAGKIRRAKQLSAVDHEDAPFDLPSGWLWVRLGALLKKIGAGSTPRGGKDVYVASGVKFLRSQNVWSDGLRLDGVAFITPETHAKMSGTVVHANDVLFNITGASIGRCAVVPADFDEANVSQHVTIIRPILASLIPFLHKVLISSHVQQTVRDVQVGVSREGLSIAKLESFLVPLPPLAEQVRIVARVTELQRFCADLRQRLVAARTTQCRLADALVESTLN